MNETLPTLIRIGTEGLTAHERDVAVSERIQMCQGEFGCESVIEHNIGYAVDHPMSGHGDDRHRERMFQRGVDCNERLRSSPDQHLSVFFDQVRPVSVMCGEIKISRFHQMVTDSAHD